MSETSGKRFVGYEYREVLVPKYLASLCADSYPCFGWEEDSNPAQGQHKSGYVNLRFKRDHKITNKAELTRLQRHFDDCIKQLEALEKSKKSQPLLTALIIGLVGTVFMGLSTFAVTAQPPNIPVCILFAIPGFVGWILPVFLYKKLAAAKGKKLTPLIEQKYSEIYDICEKGSSLLF